MTLFWIIVACVSARTAAMSFNRVADLKFDRENPRTKNRALVTGELKGHEMMMATLISSLIFFFAALMLNKTCFYLSPPTLAVLLAYSLTKRLTDYTHFFLGFALSLTPIGAWIAVTESIALTPVLLSVAVLFWVAGFDMLYSCQDYKVDKDSTELHSLPKKLGVERALGLARKLHGIALLFFFFFWLWAGLGLISFMGILLIGALLLYQHTLLTSKDLSRINAAFFSANGIISMTFLLSVIVEYMIS